RGARAVPFEQFGLRLAQDGLGQCRGPGAEVVSATHEATPDGQDSPPTLCRGAARWQLPRASQHEAAVRVSLVPAPRAIIGTRNEPCAAPVWRAGHEDLPC